MRTSRTTTKKRSTINNISYLEKLFKSRLMLLIVLCVTAIAQSVHAAMVIKHLTFIEGAGFGWFHSGVLAVCLETYIIVFSIQHKKALAIMYLIFGLIINGAMAYIHLGPTLMAVSYFVITSVFPLSTYFTAEVLGEKKKPRPRKTRSNGSKKR
jgi:hypothetical protein